MNKWDVNLIKKIKTYISFAVKEPDLQEKLLLREWILSQPAELRRLKVNALFLILKRFLLCHECPIGIEYVDEIEEKNISQITLEMMVTINKLVIDRDRLMEITVDGKITEDEYEDFKNIRKHLLEMSQAINSMKLWIELSLLK